MAATLLVLGLLLGYLAWPSPAGLLTGAILAYLYLRGERFARQLGELPQWQARIQELTARVDQLERASTSGETATAAQDELLVHPDQPPRQEVPPGRVESAPVPFGFQPAPSSTVASPESKLAFELAPRSAADRAERSSEHDWAKSTWALLAAFFSGPAAFARVGAIVLTVGMTLLLGYGSERDLLPAQARLLPVLVVGALLIGWGWRLRESREAFAVSLQGAGVAVLYATAYAGMRLHGLLDSVPVGNLALLLAVGGLSAVLALRQNSQPLAVLAATGAFLAPMVSRGAGVETNAPTLLYAYNGALTGLLVALSVRRAWPLLSVVGFAFTSATALWGAWQAEPATMHVTQGYLLGLFLAFSAIPVIWARARLAPGWALPTLVFGVPGVSLAAHGLLPGELGSLPAFLAAGILGVLAVAARRDAFLLRANTGLAIALGVFGVFFQFGQSAVTALPLEGAAFAVTAAFLRRNVDTRHVWRVWWWSAVIAQGLAVALMPLQLALYGSENTALLSAMLVALAAFTTAVTAPGRVERHVFSGLGVLGWVALLVTIADFVPGLADGVQVLLTLVALSAVLFAWLATRVPALEALRFAAVTPVPLALLTAFVPHGHDLLRLVAAVVAIAAQVALIEVRRFGWRRREMLAMYTLSVPVLALAAARFLGAEGLDLLNVTLALSALTWLVWLARRSLPLAGHDRTAIVRWVVMPNVLILVALAFVLAVRPPPSGWPVLLNPLDGLLAFTVWIALRTLTLVARDPQDIAAAQPLRDALPRVLPRVIGALAVFAVTSAVLRTASAVAVLPWDAEVLITSPVAQAALSVTWSLFGLGLMTFAVHRAEREAWFAGAGLLIVTVAKLFLLDLNASDAFARIVSFIGVGVLLLVVGYVVPVPPRDPTAANATR